MIGIFVEHFLNPEGVRKFPQWLDDASKIVSAFEGFISLRQLIAVDNPDECHLLLEFESIEHLQMWASSTVHEKVVQELNPYRLKNNESKIFQYGTIITNQYK